MQYMGGGAGEIVRVLVGNKVDLEEDRDVNTEHGRQVAENCDIDKRLFFEISALEGTGFDEMFEAIVREIRNAGKEEAATATLSLANPEKTGRSSGCACMR